ncbi:MAG: DMT family transporter [Alphaproteobacteria bacterium]|nr:DMT family transporter [Alphaproteobacteria bacterium]
MTQVPVVDNRARGVAMMLSSGLARTLIDAAGKFAVADYSVGQFNFVRSIFALATLLPLILREAGWSGLRTRDPWSHVWRSVLQVSIVTLWYLGLAQLELADATAITMGAPIVMTAMSAVWLKEKVGPRRWAAVGVGFLGMLLIIRPGSSLFNPWSLLPLIVSIAYAGFWISSRALRHRETVAALTFYPQISIFVFSGIWAAFVWQPLTQPGLIAMIIAGVGAAISHLGITLAARWAPASLLAPLDYVPLVWSVIAGYVVFGDLPDAMTVAGASLIVAAGLFIAYREARRAADQRAA